RHVPGETGRIPTCDLVAHTFGTKSFPSRMAGEEKDSCGRRAITVVERCDPGLLHATVKKFVGIGRQRIPTGFHHSAQGCADALPWVTATEILPTLKGLHPLPARRDA